MYGIQIETKYAKLHPIPKITAYKGRDMFDKIEMHHFIKVWVKFKKDADFFQLERAISL